MSVSTRACLFVALLITGSSTARADDAECARLIKNGKAQAAEKHYENARKLLHKAYGTCGDPVILVHIARTFQDEGKLEFALEYAERFLNEVEPSHPLHAALTDAAADLQAKVNAQKRLEKESNAGPTTPGGGKINQARRSLLDERAGDIDFIEEPEPGKNALYLELGGPAVLGSINYERYLTRSLTVRVGVGYWQAESSTDPDASGAVLSVPLTASYLIGRGRHSLELGGGVVAFYFSDPSVTSATAGIEVDGLVPAGTAMVGYRFSQLPRGFLLRIGYTPTLFVSDGETELTHYGGLSLGARL